MYNQILLHYVSYLKLLNIKIGSQKYSGITQQWMVNAAQGNCMLQTFLHFLQLLHIPVKCMLSHPSVIMKPQSPHVP